MLYKLYTAMPVRARDAIVHREDVHNLVVLPEAALGDRLEHRLVL